MSKVPDIVDKPGDDGVVLDEETMNKMYDNTLTNLPNVEIIAGDVEKILEFMCNDDVYQMKNQNYDDYREMMKSKFKSFEEKYSRLFELIIRGDDITILFDMLGKIQKVKDNSITMKQAESELGESLAENYVYPNLSHKQKSKVKDYIKNKK